MRSSHSWTLESLLLDVDFYAHPSILVVLRAKAHRISNTSHQSVAKITGTAAPFASRTLENGSSVLK